MAIITAAEARAYAHDEESTDAEMLAGALLVIAETTDAARRESWRKRGAAFFQSKARKRGDGTQSQPDGTLPLDGGAASA